MRTFNHYVAYWATCPGSQGGDVRCTSRADDRWSQPVSRASGGRRPGTSSGLCKCATHVGQRDACSSVHAVVSPNAGGGGGSRRRREFRLRRCNVCSSATPSALPRCNWCPAASHFGFVPLRTNAHTMLVLHGKMSAFVDQRGVPFLACSGHQHRYGKGKTSVRQDEMHNTRRVWLTSLPAHKPVVPPFVKL